MFCLGSTVKHSHYVVHTDKMVSNVDYQMICFFSRPGGIPARNHKGERLLIYLGIIDILQSYRMQKKLEHVIKSIIHDGVNNNYLFVDRVLKKILL